MTSKPYTMQDEINEFYKDYLSDNTNSTVFLSEDYDDSNRGQGNFEDLSEVVVNNHNEKIRKPCMERELFTAKRHVKKHRNGKRTFSNGPQRTEPDFSRDFQMNWNAKVDADKPVQNRYANFSYSSGRNSYFWDDCKTVYNGADRVDVWNLSNSMLNDVKSMYWQYMDQNYLQKSQHLLSEDIKYFDDDSNSSNERVYITKEQLYDMIDDINSIYKDYLNFFTNTKLEDRKSTFLQDIQSLYPSYFSDHQTTDLHKKPVETKAKSQKQATITDDIMTLYGDYLSKNEERKKNEKADNFECFVFRFDDVELGPLGKIVEIIRDDENGIYKALTVPIDDLSDYDEGTDEEADHAEKEDKNYQNTKSDSTGDGMVTGGKFHEKKTVMPNWLRRFQRKRWWKLMIKFWKFAFQFAGTMLVLCLGALCFSMIEDPVNDVHSIEHANDSHSHELVDLTTGDPEIFWEYMFQTYNGSLPMSEEIQMVFLEEFRTFFNALDDLKKKKDYEKEVADRSFIFTKWFYFMIISSTTIGFGDVVPQTNNGKVFYIFFSIVAIPLMMTLLRATGEIITMANKKFFTLVNKYLCKRRKLVSEELLSAISVLILMISYIGAGCIFTASTDQMSLLDGLYFWVNTFTTVGFGDIVPSLQTHITYISILLFYEIFGLTMLASLIDSWLMYLQYRKDQILKESRKKMLNTVSRSKKDRRKVF